MITDSLIYQYLLNSGNYISIPTDIFISPWQNSDCACSYQFCDNFTECWNKPDRKYNHPLNRSF